MEGSYIARFYVLKASTMRKIITSISILLIGLTSFSQTSVQNGNWQDPTTWDCLCVPNPFFSAITVTVNHTVTVDINGGGLYFEGGSLTIGPNGTLLQSGVGDLYMHNATTLVNGTLDMRRVAISGGTADYSGIIQNCDSLWNDSSTVFNSGTITCYDHQVYTMGEMTNSGTINITNNFNIQGKYMNSTSGVILNAVDFSNANTFGGRAIYTNNGSHEIGNNFINTVNDTIQGTGSFCIGNLSTNEGKVLGTVTFTTSGGSFSLNTGFVAPSVNFLTGACSVSVSENELDGISVYPNPFNDFLTIKGFNSYMQIDLLDLNGRIIKSELTSDTTLDLTAIESGIYLLRISSADKSTVRKIVKR